MPFLNPLNYLLTIEKVPEQIKHGEAFSTFLNPLFTSYTIRAQPEKVIIEKVKSNEVTGKIVFDIKNESAYPLFNYSSNTDHFLGGTKVRNVQIDTPYLAPQGGDNIEQTFRYKYVRLARVSAVVYKMTGYVKGAGYNQKINITRTVKVTKK